MSTLVKALLVIWASLLMLSLGACKKEGPAERTGKKIDDSVGKAGKQIDKSAGKAADKIEETGHKLKDATK